MELFDLILLILLGGFVMFGAWFGFFHTVGSLVGTVFGTLIAGNLYIPISNLIIVFFGDHQWVFVFTFLVLFMIVSRLIGFGFFLFDKSFNIITKLPFINSIDRIAGAVIGFFEGVIVIGLTLFVAIHYDWGWTINNTISDSTLREWFMNASVLLQPLFPKALKELKSIIGL